MNFKEMFGLGMVPRFRSGETVLAQSGCRVVSGKSLPSYRVTFIMPPLVDMSLIVTDRRVLLVAYVARLLRQEFSVWYAEPSTAGEAETIRRENKATALLYEGFAPLREADVLRAVSVGSSRWGTFLELNSETAKKQPLRGVALRLRCYTRNAPKLAEIIAARIGVVPPAAPHLPSVEPSSN